MNDPTSVDFWVEELTKDISDFNIGNIYFDVSPYTRSYGQWMWDRGYNAGLVNLQTKINSYCVPQWISVKDRMPEKSGIYLVYGNRESGKTAIDTADFAVHQGYFSLWNFTVTHWMSLPTPPQG